MSKDKLECLAALPLAKARAERYGLRWQVVIRASDNIDRPISFIGCRFWRWISAARIAQAINSEIRTAAWIALGEQT